jgi:hypothetical protein
MANQKSVPLHVPYRAATHGLSRLLTVNRSRCSAALPWPCHVVPKLVIKQSASGVYQL